MITNTLITTSNSLEGYRIVKQLGLVRGITVRSRSVLGNMAGMFMAIFGGKSTIYTELCENAREEAMQLMILHARELGANAIISMRYDANDVMSGLTEVLTNDQYIHSYNKLYIKIKANTTKCTGFFI